MSIESAISYLEKNRSNFFDDLKKLISFQSISGLDSHKKDLEQCADYLIGRLKQAGLEARILNSDHKGKVPVVFAQWIKSPNLPTIGIYGHYDVVAVTNKLLWDTDPFTTEIKDGKLYGRGTSDDKGQILGTILAVECLLKTAGVLPVNIKFILEGEEETDSQSLEEILSDKAIQKLLSCDTFFACDIDWYATNIPSICVGLRGICEFEINLKGPKTELHSGTHGGMVANPINVLVEMLGKLWDNKLKVTIPGFYDDIVPVDKEDRDYIAKLPFSESEYCKDIGVSATRGEEGYSPLERKMLRPSLDIVGMWGGYSGVGPKSAIPINAGAKVSMRLVANQDPYKIAEEAESYLNKICPNSVSMDLDFFCKGFPYLAPKNLAAIKDVQTVIKKVFGMDTILVRDGGSIPVVPLLAKSLGVPVVLCGVGLPSDNIHSDNEHLQVNQFYKGIEMYIRLFHELARHRP